MKTSTFLRTSSKGNVPKKTLLIFKLLREQKLEKHQAPYRIISKTFMPTCKSTAMERGSKFGEIQGN